MQCLVLLVLSFLVYNYYAEGGVIETADGNKPTFLSRLKQLIENKCLQNANRTTYEEAVEKLDHFVDGWCITLPDKRIYGDEMYNYCMKESKSFTIRLNAFLEKLTPCLDPQEYYLKDMVLDGSIKHDHYFCKGLSLTGETKDRMRKCSADLQSRSGDYLLATCFKDSETFTSASRYGDIITKEKLCSDLQNINRCCETQFEKHCTDPRGIKDIFLHMPRNALGSCQNSI